MVYDFLFKKLFIHDFLFLEGGVWTKINKFNPDFDCKQIQEQIYLLWGLKDKVVVDKGYTQKTFLFNFILASTSFYKKKKKMDKSKN